MYQFGKVGNTNIDYQNANDPTHENAQRHRQLSVTVHELVKHQNS
jgi:hypothetical protein